MDTARGNGLIVMVADAVAVAALASVIVTETVLDPLTEYVVEKLAPVPLAGVPPVAVQANVYAVEPPEPVAVNVTAVPTVPVVGPAMETARGNGLIVTVADAVAVTAFASVIVTDTVLVPFTEYVVEKLAPVPLAGVPPVAVQAKVYAVVPPEPVAVKVTAVPTVPVVGPAIETARGSAAIVTVADLVAVTALASVIVTDTVFDPLTLYVVEKLAPVPLAGVPPVAVQAKVYAVVPPDPVAVNVTAVPTVPVVGPAMLTASGSAAMVTVAEAVAEAALASVIVTDTVFDPLTE